MKYETYRSKTQNTEKYFQAGRYLTSHTAAFCPQNEDGRFNGAPNSRGSLLFNTEELMELNEEQLS